MRFLFNAKVLGLVALGMVSFSVSYANVKMGSKRSAPIPALRLPDPLIGQSIATYEIQENITLPQEGVPIASASRITELKIHPLGEIAFVNSEASMWDSSKKTKWNYMWAVRIYDGDALRGDVPIWERRYEDQIFQVASGRTHTPTFSDEIPLPEEPGLYKIQVGLYQIADGTDLDVLNNSENADNYLAAFKTVEIAR
ncbi:hypothetical protein [Tautonia plasticadhaerens]|uniref:hypothetical protein n=1 Tax=Tautonia plasticadhaerens TaxID=2527974 RepID=UPI0011A0D964|nr:hypothetical protein [Tautonia plasticadhaerens]